MLLRNMKLMYSTNHILKIIEKYKLTDSDINTFYFEYVYLQCLK